MTDTPRRYSSGIQRARGFLEIAAALYDSSLSSQSPRGPAGGLQTAGWVSLAAPLDPDRQARNVAVDLGGECAGEDLS